MRFSMLLVALIILGCSCNSNGSKETKNAIDIKNDKCFLYPSRIDSLQMKELYDTARWCIYTWHCDMLYKPKNDNIKKRTFGELELRFDKLIIKHDTLELNFNFIDRNEIILPSMTTDYRQLLTGVCFDIKSKRKISMSSPNGFSTVLKGGQNRYENPLQPEVLAYIKGNWNELNDCFKELAVREGLTK